ncbi:MAG TPA: hypothetical protein VGO47_12780 [Chlamydiales bacterium]|jgi:hypothetical protein|nr:hypothetical protein [Chlamydiales bacterium]
MSYFTAKFNQLFHRPVTSRSSLSPFERVLPTQSPPYVKEIAQVGKNRFSSGNFWMNLPQSEPAPAEYWWAQKGSPSFMDPTGVRKKNSQQENCDASSTSTGLRDVKPLKKPSLSTIWEHDESTNYAMVPVGAKLPQYEESTMANEFFVPRFNEALLHRAASRESGCFGSASISYPMSLFRAEPRQVGSPVGNLPLRRVGVTKIEEVPNESWFSPAPLVPYATMVPPTHVHGDRAAPLALGCTPDRRFVFVGRKPPMRVGLTSIEVVPNAPSVLPAPSATMVSPTYVHSDRPVVELRDSSSDADVILDRALDDFDKPDCTTMSASELQATTRLRYANNGQLNSVGRQALEEFSLIPADNQRHWKPESENEYNTRLPYGEDSRIPYGEDSDVNSVALETFGNFSLFPSSTFNDLAGRRIECY